MWSLLKKLMSLMAEFGISLDDLLRIIKDLMDLPRPPAIGNEKDFRDWVCEVLHTFIEIAQRTKTSIDDTILKMVDDAVENDTVWPMIYKLLTMVFNRDSNIRKVSATSYDAVAFTADEMKIATDIMAACDQGVKEEDELIEKIEQTYGALDPGTVVTVAVLLFEVYKYLDERYGVVEESLAPPIVDTSAPSTTDKE